MNRAIYSALYGALILLAAISPVLAMLVDVAINQG